MTVCQSSSDMRTSSPSRVTPALLTRTSRSPASSTSAARRLRVGDIGLHGSPADLGGQPLGLVAPGPVGDDDGSPCAGELGCDRAADAARGARHERVLALEGAERG